MPQDRPSRSLPTRRASAPPLCKPDRSNGTSWQVIYGQAPWAARSLRILRTLVARDFARDHWSQGPSFICFHRVRTHAQHTPRTIATHAQHTPRTLPTIAQPPSNSMRLPDGNMLSRTRSSRSASAVGRLVAAASLDIAAPSYSPVLGAARPDRPRSGRQSKTDKTIAPTGATKRPRQRQHASVGHSPPALGPSARGPDASGRAHARLVRLKADYAHGHDTTNGMARGGGPAKA